MLTNSLPLIPTSEQLKEAGENFGQLLIQNADPVEYRQIQTYGQCRNAGMPPANGLTMRFFAELQAVALKMPGYVGQVAHMSHRPDEISILQNHIARYVAKHGKEA